MGPERGLALALTALALAGCQPPPPQWPVFERVEVTRGEAGRRRVVLPSAYEAFLRGQLFFNDGEYERAQRSFEAALRSDPDAPYLLTWIARAELARHRIEEAREAIDRALEVESCAEYALCAAAEILVAEGELEGAMRSLQRAIECEPRQPEAYLQLAALLELQGASQRAETIYRDLLEVRPRLPGPHQELARLALARGDGAEAAQHLSTLLELEPWRDDVVIQAATLSLNRGGLVEAASLLRSLLARSPRHGEARRLLIRALLASGDTGGAGRQLEALRLEGDDLGQLIELATLELEARRYEAALEAARQVLARDASHPEAHRVLVTGLRLSGELEPALEAASALAPEAAGADVVRAQAGLALWEAGRLEAAEEQLRRQLAAAPGSSRSRALLVRLLLHRHRADEALALARAGETAADRLALAELLLERAEPAAALEALAAVDEAAAPAELIGPALVLGARARLAQGRELDEALALAHRAAALAPADAEARALVGALEAATGELDQGLERLEQARRRQPGSAVILAWSASALERAGRCDEATSMASQALRFRPSVATRARLEALGARCPER